MWAQIKLLNAKLFAKLFSVTQTTTRTQTHRTINICTLYKKESFFSFVAVQIHVLFDFVNMAIKKMLHDHHQNNIYLEERRKFGFTYLFISVLVWPFR